MIQVKQTFLLKHIIYLYIPVCDQRAIEKKKSLYSYLDYQWTLFRSGEV